MKDVNAGVVQPVSGYFNGGVTDVIKSIMQTIIAGNLSLKQFSDRWETGCESIDRDRAKTLTRRRLRTLSRNDRQKPAKGRQTL
jgi:hypothetical protein